MKLITEEIESAKILVEEKDGKKSMFIEGIFLQGNLKNRNNRFYPVETLEREVTRYCESFVSKGRALGELGHPDGPTVNLDRVSHKIVSLQREGNNFVGKAKLLETPMGKIAMSLLDEGVTLGVSSRGIGSLRETSEGYKVVGEDFMLATAADIVADPSAPDAFVNGIMEGVEWIWESGILKARQPELQVPVQVIEKVELEVEEKIEKTKKTINNLVDTQRLEEHKLELFQQFLSNL